MKTKSLLCATLFVSACSSNISAPIADVNNNELIEMEQQLIAYANKAPNPNKVNFAFCNDSECSTIHVMSIYAYRKSGMNALTSHGDENYRNSSGYFYKLLSVSVNYADQDNTNFNLGLEAEVESSNPIHYNYKGTLAIPTRQMVKVLDKNGHYFLVYRT